MILLEPSVRVVDGFVILPDHEDDERSYVLPRTPRLALDASGRPELSLVQYLGGGPGDERISGGILTLSTELDISEQSLAGLEAKLGSVEPVRFDSGTVELIALGASSAPGGGPGDAQATSEAAFDVRFLGSGRASLGASNRASFQLVLDATAAELMEACLDAPAMPVLVVYRMSFAGLRPSFRVDVDADWSRVYRSLQQKADLNVWYVAARADVMVSEALEESDIRVDTTVFGTSEADRAAAERARRQLVDFVLERMFEPAGNPSGTAAAVGQVVDDTVWSLTRAVVPGVGYKLRAVDEQALRLMSARMDETVAERREIIPQGAIGGFLEPFRVDADGNAAPSWPAIRSRLVTKVDLDGFRRLELGVGVEDRFLSDGLAEVRVTVGRPAPGGALADERTFALRDATQSESYVVNLLEDPEAAFATPYRHRSEVLFDPASPLGAHPPVVSEWRTGTAATLVAEPRDAYRLTEVAVETSPLFSFVLFPAVTVELRPVTATSGPGAADRVRLTAGAPSGVWRFRSFGPEPPLYEYRATYHRAAAAGGDVMGSWQLSREDWLALRDPMPDKLAVNLLTDLPWDDIRLAWIQLRYDDPANGIAIAEQVDLAPDTTAVRRTWSVAPDGPREFRYRLTLIMAGNALLEGSWRTTTDDRVVLDRRLVETRAVAMRVLGTLAEARLREARVLLQVREPSNGAVRATGEFRVLPGAEAAARDPFEWMAGDPPAKAVHYKALFVRPDGFVEQTPWASQATDLLILNLRAKALTA
jgi:hypothetical protein